MSSPKFWTRIRLIYKVPHIKLLIEERQTMLKQGMMENGKLDDMNALIGLFRNEDELITHFIGCTYFFNRDLVP